jgi:hypothetical protein
MIGMVQPLHAGNALRLYIQPPSGAVQWIVLRKASDDFNTYNDPTAFQVLQGNDRVFVDTTALVNEVTVFYRPFYTADGITWTPGPTASGIPAATYQDQSVDVQGLVRDRLAAGLAVEVARGNLAPTTGVIDVKTAPPVLDENLTFPLVSVLLSSRSAQERGIGEGFTTDSFDAIGQEWEQPQGWLNSVELSIYGMSFNGDERKILGNAINAIIVANLEVFAAAGMQLIDFNQRDESDFDSLNAPIFISDGTFTCLAPVVVVGQVDPISDVTVSVNPA